MTFKKVNVIVKLIKQVPYGQHKFPTYVGTQTDVHEVAKYHIVELPGCTPYNKTYGNGLKFPSTAVLKQSLEEYGRGHQLRNVKHDPASNFSSSGIMMKIEVLINGQWFIIHNDKLLTLAEFSTARYMRTSVNKKNLTDKSDKTVKTIDEMVKENVENVEDAEELTIPEARKYCSSFITAYNKTCDDIMDMRLKLSGVDTLTLGVDTSFLHKYAVEKLKGFYLNFSDNRFNLARALTPGAPRRCPAVILRQPVWTNQAGDSSSSQCYVCKQVLHSAGRWAMGHIKSDMCGGASTVSNLRPVCTPCNSTIGWRHMDIYILVNYF